MPAHDSATAALEQYRAYLECLAFMRLDPRLRSKFGLSDVIQNTLLEAYRDLAQLQALDPEARKRWLRKVAARNLLDEIARWRTRGRHVALEQPLREAAESSSCRLEAWLVSEESAPPEKVDRHEREVRIAEALAGLPPRQREALILRNWHGLKLAEIAEQLGCTIGAAAGLIHHGLEKLGTDLHDLG
jgi:RNA polymerase sigma-70 factor (ECF subfamily)